jgi:hypothetical protein
VQGPRGWLAWAGLGTVLSPFVVGSVASLLSLVAYEQSVGGRGTVDGVAGMINMDLASYLSLLSVTGEAAVCRIASMLQPGPPPHYYYLSRDMRA